MNLDELQSVQARERQSSDLQHLRSSFYREVGEYIDELTARRAELVEQADDPFSSTEVRQLSDDVETAEQTVEAIYERRVGKVVKKASIAAAGMPVDDDGLTAEEEALFEALVDRIERNREAVLSVLDGETPSVAADEGESAADGTRDERSDPTGEAAPADDGETEIGGATPGGVDAADLMGGDESASSHDRDVSGSDGGREADGDASATEVPPGEAPPDGGGDRPDDGSGPSARGAGRPGDGAGGADDPAWDADGPVGDADGSTGDDEGADGRSDGAVGDDGEGGSTSGSRAGSDRSRSGSAAPESTGPTAGVGAEPTDDEIPGIPRTTVRITAEVGEVVGADDRDYDLGPEDVVTLPEPNADVLVEKDAAERLE